MWRYTIEVLASGQPRPYADSRQHVRFTTETKWNASDEWKLSVHIKEDRVRELLLGLKCGFTEFRYPQDCEGKPSTSEYFRTRLDWLKEIEPGIWEFHTTSACTD